MSHFAMISQSVRRPLFAGTAAAIAALAALVVIVVRRNAERAPGSQIQVVVKPGATPDEVHRVRAEVLGRPCGASGEDGVLPEMARVAFTGGEGNSAVLTATFWRSTSRRQRDSIVALIQSSPLVVRVDSVPAGEVSSVGQSFVSGEGIFSAGPLQVVANVLGLAWLIVGWMVLLWPVTIVVGVISVVLGAAREWRTPRWMSRRETTPIGTRMNWFLLAPSVMTAVNLFWGGIFLTSAKEPPSVTPWYAYVTGVVLLIECAIAFLIFLDRRRPATVAIAVLLPQLWLGLLAAFLASWAVTSGGTLGAL